MKRYTVEEIESNQFYQMPKFLFKGEFKKLTNDARVLYSLLRDRHQLSIKNKWVNKSNEVYMIYTRMEMADMLGVTKNPVLKAINLLIRFNLLEEARQGLNKPNFLYLTHVTVENTGESILDYLDSEICPPSKTDISKTEKKVLHYLKELNNEYIDAYMEVMKSRGYKQKKVSDNNYIYINNYIKDISSYVDYYVFIDGVNEYFDTLHENNDGDILAFIKASKRILNVDIAM